MRRDLPTGTLTFFFSDIEGSTKLVRRLGGRWKDALETHERLVRDALAGTGGVEVRTIGDAFFVVFPTADGAVAAAIAAQRAHAAFPWPADSVIRMRIGMHTGIAELGGDDYVGIDVHLAARIAAAAHGGQIVVSDPTRAVLRPAEALSARDLGDHRLKDVGTLRLWQIVAPGLASEFPPLNSLEIPTNLPADPTSFVGREREADEVRALLLRQRLVTLTGPGGTGKTRLSLRVAGDVRGEFPHGVFFVPLEPIREAALVPAAVAEAIGATEEPARAVADVVTERLRDRTTLLVLDNFEQVTSAAPFVAGLLRDAPRLRCLASSREALRVRGEQEYPVSSLTEDDAVSLFVERARMVKPAFELTDATRDRVTEICRRLDRLPLAIELAAARTKLFSVDALAARLERTLGVLVGGSRDVPVRQRTLRGAIDWSHDLLAEAERVAFRRLSVFSGGCRLDAAEAVCDAAGDVGALVADALASLVDKSLLRVSEDPDGETRYSMLQTIREYAGEKLDAAGEARELRRRHAEWVVALVEASRAALAGGEDAPAIARLDAEHDNIRAAIGWALDGDESATGMRIAESVWRFWQQHGHLAEGRMLTERLLALPSARAPTVERARGLTALAGLAYWQSDFAPLAGAYGEAVDIYRRSGDRASLAEAIYNFAFVPVVHGDLERASELMEEARGLYEELRDATGVNAVNEALAVILYRQGRGADALAAEERVVAFRRAGRNVFRLVDSLTAYALFLTGSDRAVDARAALEEGFKLLRERESPSARVALLLIAARRAIRAGDAARAARIGGAVAVIRERTSSGATVLDVVGLPSPVEQARAALGDEAFARETALGRAYDRDAAVAQALA